MNEYDSKRIAHVLAPLGYNLNDDIEAADLIILNTCSIRHKAEHKVYSLLGRLKRYKKKNNDLIIAVGGCVAQQEGRNILRKCQHLNLVFGTKNVTNLPNIIEDILKTGKRYVDVNDDVSGKEHFNEVIPYYKGEPKASVTIITGCNNFCSYCIVPYVRGREESRSAADIIHEIKTLVDSGVKEVTLLGQNVNSYRDNTNGKTDFPTLLERAASIDGVKRLRFVTSHPKDLTDELIYCFKKIDKLCNHIHLPIQSGSNRILEKMNRKYTREDYMTKVDILRKVCHNISISTDVIVGFPGETKKDFQDTIDVVRRVGYDNSFSFKYSERPGTKAAEFIDDVKSEEKSERLQELQELQKEIMLSKNKSLEDKPMDVLIEGASKTGKDQLTGRTACNKIVNFSGDKTLVGKIISVNITKGFVNSLKGQII
jgi:tRNA-2-methylthio-N6-dimethylallyladenosine synthase